MNIRMDQTCAGAPDFRFQTVELSRSGKYVSIVEGIKS